MALQFRFGLLILFLSVISLCAQVLAAQSPQPDPGPSTEHPATPSGGDQPASPPVSGCISGSVVDQSGAVVPGAQVKVSRDNQPLTPEAAMTGSNGQFFLANIAPGTFQLTVTSSGFAQKTLSGVLHSGEIDTIPPIALDVASSVTEVQVGVTRQEVAQEQIKVEEKQRVLGVIPNFYVSYIPNAVALTSKQKFQLAAKTVIDPFTLVVVAGTAGVEQWQNHFIGYGQGLQGYAKRFGANYGDTLTGTFIGGAILPSLLKQDPRYFYKGTGSMSTRFVYAIGMSVICKGDNGRWQPNYSNILGNLAAGGISNLYYPPQDRSGAGLTFDNAAIGIAGTAISNVLQEFIIPKLTPHRPHPVRAQQN
jgi:hypothetical protein